MFFSKNNWKNFTKNFNFWSTDWQRNKGNAVDTLPWFVIISRLSHPRTRSGRVRSRGRIVILLEDRILGPWIAKKMGKLVCLDCLRFVSPSTTLWVQFGLIKPVKIIEKIVKLFWIIINYLNCCEIADFSCHSPRFYLNCCDSREFFVTFFTFRSLDSGDFWVHFGSIKPAKIIEKIVKLF